MLDRPPARPLELAAPATGRAPPLFPLHVEGLVLEAEGRRLIDGLDLALSADRLTVVMGPNGAGKSLLLRLLHGLIVPTAGRISWGGQNVSEAVRRRQALVFQRPVLLRRSVAANIDFVLGLRGTVDPSRRADILEHVGLHDRAQQPARLLSGGEQQRLAIGRALAMAPEVLFLDEPTASLDPASVLAIEEIVQATHRRGTKVIFVTHDVGQAKRLADEIVFVHRGRIAECAPVETFFDAPSSDAAAAYLAGRIVL